MLPDQHTIQENLLTLGDGYQIYTQEWGNPKASTTMLFVHGGPGNHLTWTISGHRAERHSIDMIKTILLHFT